MDELVESVEYNPEEWLEKVKKFNEILAQAKALEKEDQGEPLDTTKLAEAFNLYQQCNYLIPDQKIVRAARRCQEKINWRHQFQHYFHQGQIYLEQNYFKKALTQFLLAKKIFFTPQLKTAIEICEAQLSQEKEYEKKLKQVYQLAREGAFQEAFLILHPLVGEFVRNDGKSLLLKLQEIITGKAYFMAGLLAEKEGNLSLAQEKYQRAIQLIPEQEIYLIRLGIVLVKQGQLTEALAIFKNLNNEQSYYYQGFIYAQGKQWKEVYQSWRNLAPSLMENPQQIVRELMVRDRLTKIKIIEDFVEVKRLEEAQIASQDFMQKFGLDPLVRKNLEGHIIPRISFRQWKDKTLPYIQLNQEAEKQWKQAPTLISLHNLMISQYYLFHENQGSLASLIPLWMTGIANLDNNPILVNIPWLISEEIKSLKLGHNLQELLEQYLEKVKENNLEEYLTLRDIYRREKWCLNLIEEEIDQGIKINQLVILPGCYEKYYRQNQYIKLSLNMLGALYTAWGYAVGACLEKDYDRALQIRPNTVTSEVEKFAQTFVFYHLGCFYLENNQWCQAIEFLQEIKPEILDSWESLEYLDQLCQKQRHKIDCFSDHLEFSQFWYNLLETPLALDYFMEYQAQKIILNLEQEKISYSQALFQLKQLQKMEINQPIVNNLIEKLEFEKELKIIHALLKEKEFEEAIERAKQSKHEKIKIVVAELFIHILLEGFKNHELNFNDIYKLGSWAYELYPEEPTVQEIYDLSQELFTIQNLMLNDQFDEAVVLAKYSDHDLVRQYVTEFFIKTLLTGLESGEIPPPMIKQLALWAYCLAPDDPSYQQIYQSLDIIK